MDKVLEEFEFISKNYTLNESLYSISNGYIGMRGSFEEGVIPSIKSIPGTYINGYYELIDINYSEKYTGYPDLYQRMLPVVNIQNIELYIDEIRFLFDQKMISNYSFKFNLNTGEVNRKYTIILGDCETIEIEFIKIISSINYEFLYQKIVLKPNLIKTRNIKIICPLYFTDDNVDKEIPNDPANSFMKFYNIENSIVDMNTQLIEYSTKKSKIRYGWGSKLKINTTSNFSECKKGQVAEFNIKKSVVEIEKYSVIYDQNYDITDIVNVEKMLEKHFFKTYKNIVEEQKNKLKQLWHIANSDIGATDPNINLYNDYNLFQLYSNIPKLNWLSVPAKGLTGEGYGGHYFWDTEIYIIIPLIFIDPTLAKQLIMFRYKTLSHAKERAKLLGHPSGALFPWRTINGNETSTYYPAGTAQYHINGDISYAVVEYFKVTGDIDFLLNYGLDILIETARVWADKITVYNKVAHICSVTGPDEYQLLVNDDYYTNCIAKYNLIWAAKSYEILKSNNKLFESKVKLLKIDVREIKNFLNLSKILCISFNKLENINPQHDNFLYRKKINLSEYSSKKPFLRTMHPLAINNLQITKQADVVLANLLFPKMNNADVMKSNYFYYDKIDTSDSSLSKSIYAIMACRLNIGDFGFDYFLKNVYLDINDTHVNSHRGLHMAGMGGNRMFMLFGLLGLTIEENYIKIDPKINSEIKNFSLNIKYRGQLLKFDVSQTITIINVGAKNLDIFIRDKKFKIKGNEVLRVEY